ncbi:MAG: hypothetical protein RMJ31_06040 [Nitrososphaerota archaeon]|nr:hypothetical protein [Nitrososphaerales archaeon]MDW8045314.1 hypothetical protein [Nitrososphaerota archaeon]
MIELLYNQRPFTPLSKVEQAGSLGLLRPSIVNRIKRRMKYVEEGVARVERASGIPYPKYYIEPALPVVSSSVEVGKVGILYARTLPLVDERGLEIYVELSAPLILHSVRTTIHAVLAHEFLHYLELVRRFIKLETISDEQPFTLFESRYFDSSKLYDAKRVLKDRALVKLIERRFSNGLVDEKLNQKVAKLWIGKKMPMIKLSPEIGTIKIPISSILNARFDPLLVSKLNEWERESSEGV